jgi:tungstate transport system permease protein
MGLIIQGVLGAFHLIFSGNPDIIEISLRSVKVSGIATLIAFVFGLPIGLVIGLYDFKGKHIVRGLFNGLLGIPTVVLGLILYLILVPLGPFGSLKLIYTEMGISLGQAILVLPIVISLVAGSVSLIRSEIRELAITLGAGELEASIAVIREAIGGVILSIVAAFNRAVAELGVALMIGGNIFVKGSALNTRVLTTSIQMYTARGEIDLAIALGVILLFIVFGVSMISNVIQSRLT